MQDCCLHNDIDAESWHTLVNSSTINKEDLRCTDQDKLNGVYTCMCVYAMHNIFMVESQSGDESEELSKGTCI